MLLGPCPWWAGLGAGDSTIHTDCGSDISEGGFGREREARSNVGEVELVVSGGRITLPRARQLEWQLSDVIKSNLRIEITREG